MKISLGCVPFYWPADTLKTFYQDISSLPMDIVYLGESVCSKRRELSTAEWIELGQEIARSGKQAVLSSLALIEARSELTTLKRLCDNGEMMVEANDMAAAEMMHERGLPFVAGNGINIYNASTLRVLHRQGMVRWLFPVELSAQCLADILRDAQDMGFANQVETEVLSYGHLGLAYSARCFTARAHLLPKDRCKFICKDYPEGLPLTTQEDQELFTLNGIQVMSGEICNLLPEAQAMHDMGVDIMRITPTTMDMADVINGFRDALDGKTTAMKQAANAFSNGYWYGKPGMDHVETGASLDV